MGDLKRRTPRRPRRARIVDSAEVLKGMTEAVREAIFEHKRSGHPIAIWRDERVVWLQPDEIPDTWTHGRAPRRSTQRSARTGRRGGRSKARRSRS